MKKIINRILLAILSTSLLFSCGKEMEAPGTFSGAVIFHTSPGTPSIDIFIDTVSQLGSPLNYLGNSAYLGVEPGTRKISIINQSADGKRTTYAEASADLFEAGKSYSYFLYDTLISGKSRMLRLNDDLTRPETGKVHVRFLNLAPSVGSLDLTLVRGTFFTDTTTSRTGVSTFVATDSVTISNVNYAGETPDVVNLSKFTPIMGSTSIAAFTSLGIANVPTGNQNNRYVYRIKRAGTNTVLLTSGAAASNNTVNLTSGRAYTIFATGSVKGVALSATLFQNFQ